MENMKAIPVDDEALEAAAGGGGRGWFSQWEQYATYHVLLPLCALEPTATGNDKIIIDGIISTLEDTIVPRVPIAKTVINLWRNFDPSSIKDTNMRTRVTELLEIAYKYAVSHG